jgi:hypothetical protein
VYTHRRKEMVLMSTHLIIKSKTLVLLLRVAPLLLAPSRSGSGCDVDLSSPSPAGLLRWCLHVVGSRFCRVLVLLFADGSRLSVSGPCSSVCSAFCWISSVSCSFVCWDFSDVLATLLCVCLLGFAGCWEVLLVVRREVGPAAESRSAILVQALSEAHPIHA